MRRLTGLLILILCLAPLARAAEPTAAQLREDFEFFWNSYREAYVFFELKGQEYGVDWQQLRQEYEPTLAQCSTKADLVRLITEMQTRLHDGHCQNEGLTALGPISLVRGIAFTAGAGGKVLVRGLAAEGPLVDAGVARGDEVLTWAGQPVATLARRSRSLLAASSEGQFWAMFTMMMHVYNPLLGTPPATCSCSFRKADGTVAELELPWTVIDPTATDKAGPSLAKIIELDAEGPLPIKAMLFEDLNIGYMSVESFMKTDYPKDQLDKVMGALKDTDALILDLRSNGGGVGPWGVLLANYFVDEGPDGAYMERLYSRTFFKAILGQVPPDQLEAIFHDPTTMRMLFGKLGISLTGAEMQSHFENGEYVPFYHSGTLKDMVPQDLQPGIPAYTKPVFALTNGGCFSTTDICLQLLKEFNRIKIVGTPNGAGSGSPIPCVLPNCKVKVMVPHARAYPPSGDMIEGHPIQPDVVVETTGEDLAQGVDRPLITALGMAARAIGLIDPAGSKFGGAPDILPTELATRTLVDIQGSRIPAELQALIPSSVREAQLQKAITSRLVGDILKEKK